MIAFVQLYKGWLKVFSVLVFASFFYIKAEHEFMVEEEI